MDEEDIAELAESRKLVDHTEEMDLGGTEAEVRKRKGPEADDEGDEYVVPHARNSSCC